LSVAAFLAGCGPTSGNSSSSSVTITGNTLTIYVSEPAAIASDPNLQDVAYAEQLAFHQFSSLVSGYHLRIKTVRDATVTDNAREAIQDTSAIAYLGELQPGTSQQTVGITDALDLLELSPTDTATMIDSDFESLSTYHRNFVRVPPDNTAQGQAIVSEIKTLGAGSSLYIADDGSGYGRATAAAVRSAASAASVTVAGSESGASAIFYGSDSPQSAAKFFSSAASSDSSAKLFGPSALFTPALSSALSSSVTQLYVSVPGDLPSGLGSAGRAFAKEFSTDYGHQPSVQAYLGYQAMTGLLRAMAGAKAEADNRTTVIKDVNKQKFDAGGFVIARLKDGSLTPWRNAPAS
jgi:ABC-type branched-subunit amino acid transport system substrate-binding protein